MKQQLFESERAERWSRFEAVLEALDRGRGDPTGEFPRLYRQVCQDLALARDRLFTEELIVRLHRMALRGHEHLYAARATSASAALELVRTGFPRAVRREAALVIALGLLFFGSMGLATAAVQRWPDLPRSFVDESQLQHLEDSYRERLQRSAAEDVGMFGFYVWNNVSIAFDTFAGGLLFGVGSLLILLINGVALGLMTGHIVAQGLSESFFTFVIGHGSFELTAIVLAAVGGLRIGLSIVTPGRLSRRASLRRAATGALPLLYGTGGMLVVAAGIEAFWSATAFGPPVKYTVGAGLWVLVAAYFVLGGRERAA